MISNELMISVYIDDPCNLECVMSAKVFKVKALYAFLASHPDDLAFNEGEVLTVTNGDYAEGWFYGRNAAGKNGMIPSAYVDPLPPSMPPPPLPGNVKVGSF